MNERIALSVAIAAALLSAQAAQAQEAATAKGQQTVEEVTVTGSRIQRDGYSAPTPVTVATSVELTTTTPTTLADGLNKLPQFQMSSSPSRGLHNWPREDSHGNVLNLRSVGGARTLVLMDGMRVPPTNFPGTVDVSVIPNLLVDRVEIVTGGASAAYGADAVAGVVNFVLDKDYTGVKGLAQGGVDGHGDNENYRAAMAGGFNFAEDRGHVLLSAEIYDNKGMDKNARKVDREGWMYVGSNTACTPDPADATACLAGGARNPFTKVRQGRLNTTYTYGRIQQAGFSLNNYKIVSPTAVAPFNFGTLTGSPALVSGGDGLQIPLDTTAVAGMNTRNFFGRTSFDFTDDLSGYVQGTYSVSKLDYKSLSNATSGAAPVTIYSGNPFLPAVVQAAMTAENFASIVVNEYGDESPKPETKEKTDYFNVGFGLEGKAFGEWRWNVGVNHGESKHTADQSPLYEWSKMYAALDAVRDANGSIVCRASIDPRPEVASRYANCKPLNILGGDPAVMTPDGWAYANRTSSYVAKFKQTTIAANLSGSVFDLPAGPLDVAFGAEYRKADLELTSNADPQLLDNRDANFNFVDEQSAIYGPAATPWLRGVPAAARTQWNTLSNQGSADAEDKVVELYGEVNIPLLAGKPFAARLDLNGAFRYTDYDSSGSVRTWKVGMQWRPIDSVLFRGTVSRDIRAPSLYSIGRGDSFRIGFLVDPVTNTSGNITQVEQGNPTLRPEKSDAWTFGVVFTPESVPGLSFAIDYYSMEIDGAIGLPDVVQVVQRCADDANAKECAQVVRPAPNAFPTLVTVREDNIAFLETAGIDIEANYGFSVGAGNLLLHASANYLDKFKTQSSETARVLSWRGIAGIGTSVSEGRPKWMGVLNARYGIGNFSAVIAEQYIGKMTVGRPGLTSNFVDPGVGAVWTTDLSLLYDFEIGGGTLQAFVTVNNLFDRSAPIIPSTLPASTPVTIPGVYDYIGRAFNAGVRFEF